CLAISRPIMITFDTDASLEWCSTSPLWHIDAVGRGVHPIIKSRLLTARSGRFEPMALRRVVPILVVAILTSGADANEVDPIIEQYRAEDIDGLLKPALQKAEALALEGRVSESNQALLDAVPEAKRQPVHDLALGNVLYRTRPDISRALHRKAV